MAGTRLIWQITSHLERLQTVEKELAALKGSTHAKDEASKARAEAKKLYVYHLLRSQTGRLADLRQDSLHVEMLDLRAHVWGVEQDLAKMVKQGE